MSSYSSSMTTLSYIFFFIAGVWLIAALLYSLLVLCFLRLRARGELGNMDDEDFGRVEVWGRCYLPLGCIFRRYARHLQMEEELGLPQRGGSGHFMNKEERRRALNILLMSSRNNDTTKRFPQNPLKRMFNLSSQKKESEPEDTPAPESPQAADTESACSEDIPMCSICLCEYEPEDTVFVPTTCSHQFHCECILDWLQLPGRTDCPCCRVPIVSDDQIWKTVKQLRKEHQKAIKKQRNDPQEEISETEDMDDSSSSIFESDNSEV